MNIQNTFHQAISISDNKAEFGDPVALKTNTLMSLISVVQETLNLVSGIDQSQLTVTANGSEEPIYLVRYNRCIVGMIVHPLDGIGNECEDTPLPVGYASGGEWLEALKDIAARHPDCQVLVDSIPACMKEIDKLGKSHVIVPDSANMTEDMIDASRGLLLYIDTHDNHSIEAVRHRIGGNPWFKRVAPKWFTDGRGHLTKMGRATLAYDLTIKAHTHPKTESEHKWGNQRTPVKPHEQRGYKITFSVGQGRELVISRAFGTRYVPEKHGDSINLQINRHQLPEAWRALFTKQAISFKGTVVIGADGISTVDNCDLTINLREKAAPLVSWKINPSVVIPE